MMNEWIGWDGFGVAAAVVVVFIDLIDSGGCLAVAER